MLYLQVSKAVSGFNENRGKFSDTNIVTIRGPGVIISKKLY